MGNPFFPVEGKEHAPLKGPRVIAGKTKICETLFIIIEYRNGVLPSLNQVSSTCFPAGDSSTSKGYI